MNARKKSLPIRNLHLGLALALILGTLCITTPSAARDVLYWLLGSFITSSQHNLCPIEAIGLST